MSYALDSEVQQHLVADPTKVDRDVARVEVVIRPDHYGEDSLYFRVVLRDGFQLAPTSPRIGRRLARIANVFRRRAIEAQIPLHPFVRFVLESEVAPIRRRRAA